MTVGDKILAKNLMILASAGSGKTFQLGHRIIALVGAHEVDPQRIVALTFTRKAAGEFADSVLTKLAVAVLDESEAAELQKQIGSEFSVPEVFESVVRAVPRLQLGTMDGFFTRVVRGFQYELGLSGGSFELIEGPRLQSAMAEILTGVLGGLLEEGKSGEEFLHAFRRATLGKEGQGVHKLVDEFMQRWHWVWKAGVPIEGWGGSLVWGELPEVEAWESEKSSLVKTLRDASDRKDVEKLLRLFEDHTVGSGKLAKGGVLFARILEKIPGSQNIEVEMRGKPVEFDAMTSQKWRELYALVAGCELRAAVTRTQAVGDLVRRLDEECERRLRNKGLLGFDDVKQLMGAWSRSEEDRLRREKIDFRLDARYDHWLLDEFQDTSQAEWGGIEPLLDEAAGEGEGSVFVVGDRKQAIYGWRGGDVSLFDRVEARYGGDLEVCAMPESYRSCPAVLELVNGVCGNFGVIEELFGEEMARRWQWDEHVSARAKVSGCARVEEVGKDEMKNRLAETLREVGVGKRELSCGVLVRTNSQVVETAAFLREEGFDVIEEGRRLPVEDNPVGVALHHLIRWLADPADAYAREVITMSPLAGVLEKRFGEYVHAQWEGGLALAMRDGFAPMVESLLAELWDGLSLFARKRVGDVVGALAEFDAGAGSTAREARDWISRLEIAQAPGVAAVQVMTVHKSKGLGFDVVVLPSLEDRQVPDRGKYEIAKGDLGRDSWVLQPPAKWVRDLLPALQLAESSWADEQRYEAMCLLYVALTRAKRGLYVLLPEVPKSRKDLDHYASLANWVRLSVGGSGNVQWGVENWYESVSLREVTTSEISLTLGKAMAKRSRQAPSSMKPSTQVTKLSGGGARLGSEVHRLFESINWLEPGEIPQFPRTQAGAIVEDCLREHECHQVFESKEGNVSLFREQSFEVLLKQSWVTGTVDRMHLYRDEEGRVVKVEIYDFKTDRVEEPSALRELYGAQMDTYRQAMHAIFACEEVKSWIVSTALQKVIEVPSDGSS